MPSRDLPRSCATLLPDVPTGQSTCTVIIQLHAVSVKFSLYITARASFELLVSIYSAIIKAPRAPYILWTIMDNPRPVKRSRLSLACDRCRSRKVRCDDQQPVCRPCQSRNETCVTTDPRRPGVPVVREVIDFGEPTSREATTIGHDISTYDKALSPLRYNTKSFGTASGTDHNKKDRLRAGSSQSDTHDISPVQQPFYEVSFSTDGRPNKAKMMGGQ